MYTISCNFKVSDNLTLMSDYMYQVTPPYNQNITSESNRGVLRVNKMIPNQKALGFQTNSLCQEMYREHHEKYAYWCLDAKSLKRIMNLQKVCQLVFQLGFWSYYQHHPVACYFQLHLDWVFFEYLMTIKIQNCICRLLQFLMQWLWSRNHRYF